MELSLEFYFSPTKAKKLTIDNFAILFESIEASRQIKTEPQTTVNCLTFSGEKIEAAPYYPLLK